MEILIAISFVAVSAVTIAVAFLGLPEMMRIVALRLRRWSQCLARESYHLEEWRARQDAVTRNGLEVVE